MSEIKLNLVDAQQTLHGTIHASVADRVIAALSAEPENISELVVALTRYQKQNDGSAPFQCLIRGSQTDNTPWDAGLLIVDLPARLIFIESTDSYPKFIGDVEYHDGEKSTDLLLPYRIPDDWLFVNSIEEYESLRGKREKRRQMASRTDVRQTLYGRPVLEHIAHEIVSTLPLIAELLRDELPPQDINDCSSGESPSCLDKSVRDDAKRLTMLNLISGIHTKWLTSAREDLSGVSPRVSILARQNFIDFDLHTREMQWSFQLVGPPCLPTNSDAYRFAGFGTHEWVIYYDLVRQLICAAVDLVNPNSHACSCDSETSTTCDSQAITSARDPASITVEALVCKLEGIKDWWLESPNEEYSGRVPANLIENERKRLPIALSARDMIVDDDCPICRMMADDMELSGDIGFWHLDGSHMDPDFVFSSFLTREEWEADQLRWKEFHEEFDREWAKRNASEEAKSDSPQGLAESACKDPELDAQQLVNEGVEICTADPF